MIHMTDDISHWLEIAPGDGVPCLVGTSDKGGHPQISPKGSVAVFDPETLPPGFRLKWHCRQRPSMRTAKQCRDRAPGRFVVVAAQDPRRVPVARRHVG